MAHPFSEKRDHKVQHDRVSDHLKGYKNGGGHSDVAQDKTLIRSMVKKSARKMRMAGGPVRSRADRAGRAHGGRTKKGGKAITNVHINVAHPSSPPGGAIAAPGVPPVRPVPQPVPMPPPGMGGPPPGGMPPMGGPPPGMGGPPGLPMRAKGGRIKPGPGWTESMKNETPVQHSDGKKDGKDIGRKRVVTFKSGGRIVSFKAGGRVKREDGGSAPYTPPGSRGTVTPPTTRRQTTDEPPPPKKAHGGPINAPPQTAKAKHRAMRAMGGPIDTPRGAGVLTPHLPGGSGGGLARLRKQKLGAAS